MLLFSFHYFFGRGRGGPTAKNKVFIVIVCKLSSKMIIKLFFLEMKEKQKEEKKVELIDEKENLPFHPRG